MDDDKRRLQRLNDDLVDIRDSGRVPFGFGIVISSTSIRLPHPMSWQFLERQVVQSRGKDEPIPFEPNPWFDPFPDGSACIRWWGDEDGVKEFKDWAKRASNVIRKHPEWLSEGDIARGYHWILSAFVRFAKKDADLKRLVKTRQILDSKTVVMACRSQMPSSLWLREPLPIFFLEEVGFATRFGSKVAEKLLGAPAKGPRLSVNVEKNEVMLDGTTYGADIVYVLILHELLNAKGLPITRSRMQTMHKILNEEARLDRKIADIRNGQHGLPFCIPIKTAEKKSEGYFLPVEYLE